ncbi:MAG: hypothetical protein NW223_24785 [Hyphomicrobiaceae bacterium]|nr:hypothetical protein [Hyphomicrobiaceae bacterium]
MIRRTLTYIVLFPVAIALIALGVVNTHTVELVLDPFRPEAPAVAISLPFYAFLFVAVLVGIVIGSWTTWRSQAHWRRDARRRTVEAQRWQAEADRLSRERDRMLKEQAAQTALPPPGGGTAAGLRQIAGAR